MPFRSAANARNCAPSDSSDRELRPDIGTTRGEIDYVASQRGIDPRDIRFGEWLRYLPTVEGQIGPIDFR